MAGEAKPPTQRAVVLVSSSFSKGVGFFIDNNQLVTSMDAVADRENKVVFPTKSIRLSRGGEALAGVKVTGYKSFSLLLNLAVLKVQGYEGPVLPFEETFDHLIGHGEAYMPVFNKGGVLKTLSGQVMGGGSYHIDQYISSVDVVRGSPVLNGRGSLQAVVFKREHGGQSVRAIPLSLLKDLIYTDFEWHTLKNIHHVFKKIQQKDQHLLEQKTNSHPMIISKGYAQVHHGDFYVLNSTEEEIAEKESLIKTLAENAPKDNWPVLFYQLATMHYKVLFDRGYFKSTNHHEKDTKDSQSLGSSRQKMILNFEKAAQMGHVLSQYHLGQFYLKEYEVKKDLLNRDQKTHLIKTSVRWHKEAAEQGYALSQLVLGTIYEASDKARHWLEKAAVQDVPQAAYRLGILYMEEVLRENKKSSYSEFRGFVAQAALQWWAKAAELDYGPAFFALAELYRKGWGVKKNQEKANVLYQAACTRGWTGFDKKILTTLYPDRVHLEEKKVVERLIFLAHQDYTPASYTLGQFYHRGHLVASSLEEARRWYRKVALKGDKEAQFDLAQTYRGPLNSWSDIEEAKKWLTKSQAGGHQRAGHDLEEIKTYEKTLKQKTSKKVYEVHKTFLFVVSGCLSLFY